LTISRSDGIGAFEHVRRGFGLPTHLEAIAHLAKGRQTTDPTRHTGEGIFFTSRIFDRFELDANGFTWTVDNERSDQSVAPSAVRPGARVTLGLDVQTARSPQSVFEQYTDPESLRVSRTRVRVSLADYSDQFVSRSEAKRLAMGLDQYEDVELDFTGVRAVGQGFVDELFRVWLNDHPTTSLHPINMSREVGFMVNRGLG
jgi:hypothetical protein